MIHRTLKGYQSQQIPSMTATHSTISIDQTNYEESHQERLSIAHIYHLVCQHSHPQNEKIVAYTILQVNFHRRVVDDFVVVDNTNRRRSEDGPGLAVKLYVPPLEAQGRKAQHPQ